MEVTLAAWRELAAFDLDAISLRRGSWMDHIAGTAEASLRRGCRCGFRGLLPSTLPISGGLSSSAALEMAAAWALTDPPGGRLDVMTVARLAQRAESRPGRHGRHRGLRDRLVSSLGRAGAALLLDCRSLEYRPVALVPVNYQLVVCDPGSPRRLESSQYHARRVRPAGPAPTTATRTPSASPGSAGGDRLRHLDADQRLRSFGHGGEARRRADMVHIELQDVAERPHGAAPLAETE